MSKLLLGPGSHLALAILCSKACIPLKLPIAAALTPYVYRCVPGLRGAPAGLQLAPGSAHVRALGHGCITCLVPCGCTPPSCPHTTPLHNTTGWNSGCCKGYGPWTSWGPAALAAPGGEGD